MDEPLPHRGRMVVIVEDDPIVSMVAKALVGELGLPVSCHGRADDALDYIVQDVAQVSIVFTDVSTPGRINGLELAHQVFARWPWIRIVITSGNDRPQGADIPPNAHFIPKPWMPLDVITAMA